MSQPGPETSIEARALEIIATVAIALLAADEIREALHPIWQTMRQLFGI